MIMENNKQKKAERIYRKLLSYFENKIPIHINSVYGFRNGLIIDLSEVKYIVVISDIKESSPILLEDIYEDSIDVFKEKKKNTMICNFCQKEKEEFVTGTCKECAEAIDNHICGGDEE